MTTPAQRVHLKLLSLLPVRTIQARKPDSAKIYPRKSGEQLVAQTEYLHQRILDLYRNGLKRYEIAKRLGIAGVTVWRHLKGLQP